MGDGRQARAAGALPCRGAGLGAEQGPLLWASKMGTLSKGRGSRWGSQVSGPWVRPRRLRLC